MSCELAWCLLFYRWPVAPTTYSKDEERIFCRADTSSVIRKPAVKNFGTITMPNPQADADDDRGDVSCDCGWPYNLLLPRGTVAGMSFRLLVMLTDCAIDQVPDDTTCGSMSYCGAKDKYPDSRGMGYPFNLPFPAGQTIPVMINSVVTELGNLELWMKHTRSDRRWKLEFQLRME